jgi:hypothetical protein
MQKKILILLISSILLLPSCEDEFQQCLDNPDCEYFRCKVNGEDWSTNCESDFLSPCSAIDVQYYKSSGGLESIANNQLENQNIRLNVKNPKLKLGDNRLFLNDFIKTQFVDGKQASDCKLFPLDTTMSNNLFITAIDTINFRIEGTFYFTGKNSCDEIRKITDGVFRVTYRF